MFLYIDPGTGSMLITIIIGLFGTGLYFLRNIFVKIRLFGKKVKVAENKLPIVVFSDDKRYWNIFEPILDELEKREEKTVYLTESEDDPALENEYKYIETRCIGDGNSAFALLNHLNACIVLSTTPSLDVFQWKRSKDVDYYIHIVHMPNDITTYKMFGLDYYDAVLLSGKFQGKQIRQLEKIRRLPEKELEYVGLSYLDSMKKRLEVERRLDDDSNDVGKKSFDKTILLAPSWGDNGILKKYGSEFIKKLIDTGYKIIIRPHPQSFKSEKDMIEGLMEAFPESDKLKWNRDNDNFKVLMNSDILISDFSGVIFDYAMVFDKPVIFTPNDFDKSTYDAAWLDEELWTYNILPKLGMEISEDSFGDIGKVVEECLKSEKLALGREEARKEAWLNMGHCAESTVDYIVKKKAEIQKDSEEKTEVVEEVKED